MFATNDDAIAFLNLVAVYPKRLPRGTPIAESLYGRIKGYGSARDWRYTAHAENYGVEGTFDGEYISHKCIGPADFDFSISVRFPVADIRPITRRLKAALRP